MHPRRQAVIDKAIATDHYITDKDVDAPKSVLREVAIEFINSYEGNTSFVHRMKVYDSSHRLSSKQLAACLRIMVAEAREPAPSSSSVPTADVMRPIPEGRYTVVLRTHPHLEYTFWITPYEGGMLPRQKGVLSVRMLIGPDNTRNYKPCAFIYPTGYIGMRRIYSDNQDMKSAISVLVKSKDKVQFGEAYALKSRKCWRCHKDLTRSTSIIRGLGPTCAKSLGLL